MNSPKLRRVIGLDWGQVFFDNETAIMNNRSTVGLVQMSRLLRGHVLPQRDICHVLTLETNGSVFSNRILKQANRRIFAKRLVDNINTATRMVKSNSKEDECYRCDCMLNKDRLSAHEECVLCQDRKHTLPYRSRTSGGPVLSQLLNSINGNETDWHMDTKQEWTDEDERHFQEIHGSDTMNNKEDDVDD